MADRCRLLQRAPHRRQITRPAPLQRQPGKRALHIGHLFEPGADLITARVVFHKPLHHIKPIGDRRQIIGRAGQPAFEQPRAAAGQGAVHHCQQRIAAPAGKVAHQFEVAPGGGIYLHMAARFFLHRRGEQWHFSALGQLQIIDNRAHRRQLRPGKLAKTLKRGHRKQLAKPPIGHLAVKARRRKRGQRLPGGFQRVAQPVRQVL